VATATFELAGANQFAGFSSSTASSIVTVTAPTASKVVVTLTTATSNQPGVPFAISLQETAGVPTTVTGWTIAGTNFTSIIAGSFGSNKRAAKGNLKGMLIYPVVANAKSAGDGICPASTRADSSGRKRHPSQ
jgi:hypothetical protein